VILNVIIMVKKGIYNPDSIWRICSNSAVSCIKYFGKKLIPLFEYPTMYIRMCCFVVEILNTFIKLKNEKIKTSHKKEI